MTPAKDTDRKPTAEQTRARQLKALRAALAAYEVAEDLVPGTARNDGTLDRPQPAGGQSWEGLARMAYARHPHDRTERDLDAIARHPNPPSGVTGTPATA